MELQKDYYQKLEKIFIGSELDIWQISEKDLINSEEIKKLSILFPKWYDLVKKGIEQNRNEAFRTLRHTFHTLYNYFSIINNQFEKNIDKKNILLLKNQLRELYEFQPLYFPLILLYHDLSRPFNRTWHTIESEKLIREHHFLDRFNLSKSIQKLILTSIKHHLLIGTIFTGESSYYGSIALYSDLIDGDKQISNHYIQILFQTLKFFTFIDIWGYYYSQIYNHYFDYYDKICVNLTEVFTTCFKFEKEGTQKNYLEKSLFRLDTQNLKWRIACSLRIFQFITVKPYLTKDFYYSKIEEGLALIGKNWEQFQKSLGENHSRIQFKYTLPLMMVLSMKEFRREPIDESITVQDDIFSFWSACSQTVRKFISKHPDSKSNLFYYVFDFPRSWFFNSEYREKIKKNVIKILSSAKFSFDSTLSDYIVNINLEKMNKKF